ncbi:MAG TPA: tetraacyldisaccharide 4'-kinase [Thermoanaerobaculaceae bacterium]|nr:tetraacyldisaccharide 4'-kinase [Thermoanaerobaculaceae bacterium]
MRRWPAWLLGFTDIMEAVNATAYAAYRYGLRKRERAAVPVISVGNIAFGGTGKTPLVAALARTLLAAGARPAILTRGYRRRESGPVVIWKSGPPGWEQVGDEPALLARALPDVPIVVDPDRVRGAAIAVRETGATHLLLDDGFQHWRLARDLDIVAVEASDPVCATAPRREHPNALARAHAIVLSRVTDRTEAAAGMAVLGPYAPDAKIFATRLVARGLHRGGERQPADSLKGVAVTAMAGIASPEGLIHTLGDLDANITDMKFYSDHHRYSRREVEKILAEADRTESLVVTTAKDIVKLPSDLSPRVAWLEVEAVPLFGSFEELLAPILGSPKVESQA